MNPAGPMAEARRYLAGLGLPDRDLGELPTSAKRFRDGAQYRVEIPSVEGPEPFRAVVDWRRFTYAWCKAELVPGEKLVVSPESAPLLPPPCRGPKA